MAKTVKLLLHDTLLNSKKSVATLSDETGMSASYLYRACNPEDDSGVRFPLDYLIPLMLATKNYTVLKHIASICGFVLTSLPKAKLNRKEKNSFVSEYQETTIVAAKYLVNFFEEPSEQNYKNVTIALQKVLEITVTAKQ